LVNKQKKDEAVRKEMQPAITKAIKRLYNKKAESYRTGGAGLTAAAKLAMLRTRDGAQRWWNRIQGYLSYIVANSPSSVAVSKDDPTGRDLLYYPGQGRKSVSWTSRGMSAASVEVITQWWAAHTLAIGEQCPLPII
jgi:hypothetical protein